MVSKYRHVLLLYQSMSVTFRETDTWIPNIALAGASRSKDLYLFN